MFHTQLRSFHAVASRGSFTAAGQALHIGQPTVTRQVKELEEHFGVQLFYRRGRLVELTSEGKMLLELTRRMFSLESEARDRLNAAGGFHSGHLEIGAVGPYHVTEMLARFHDRYPDLTISIRTGNSQDVLQGLLDFQTDVAVLAQWKEDDRFFAMPYSKHPYVAFVNTDHPWTKQSAVYVRDFEGQNVILREPGSTTRRSLEAALLEVNVHINSAIEIGSREAIWWAVLQGLGIGVVSEYEFIPHPRLRALQISDLKVYNSQYVVCLAERRNSRLVHAFLEIAKNTAKTRVQKRRTIDQRFTA